MRWRAGCVDVHMPKHLIDRSKFPNADEDYTPAQRKIIDARLAESEQDLKEGRTFGPFNGAAEMIASMKHQLKKLDATKLRTKRTR